jgi:hypothetical protein
MALTPAEALLRELLADGAQHPSVEVEALALARGITPRSLDRARAKLGVIAAKNGVLGGWSMQLNSAPAKTVSVDSTWPEYAYMTCDTCDYSVYSEARPRHCHCKGTLQARPTTPRLA